MSDKFLQFLKYLINGVSATLVHYGVLSFNLNILHFSSAAIANMLAAVFGITASYLGNRFFVFDSKNQQVTQQFIQFLILYAAIALLHGLILWVWTDQMKLHYSIGFLIATVMQFVLSFIGNKFFIFKS